MMVKEYSLTKSVIFAVLPLIYQNKQFLREWFINCWCIFYKWHIIFLKVKYFWLPGNRVCLCGQPGETVLMSKILHFESTIYSLNLYKSHDKSNMGLVKNFFLTTLDFRGAETEGLMPVNSIAIKFTYLRTLIIYLWNQLYIAVLVVSIKITCLFWLFLSGQDLLL